jgi:diguanylate cyclase (GGDEF)-like protein
MEQGIPLRVLVVEDDDDDDALVLRALSKGDFLVAAYARVQTEAEMLAALEQNDWDIVLSDYRLPTFSAPEALAVLKRHMKTSQQDLPFIVISGTIGEEAAVAMMREGAADYLLKDRLGRLAPAVARELREAADRRQRRTAEEQVYWQSRHDALTSLPNRTLFEERLARTLQLHRRDERIAVLFMDLDQFKVINDSLGHGVGDRLLQQVASRLSACLRGEDTLSRWGGDEFTALLPRLSAVHEAAVVARKLLGALKRPFRVDGQTVFVSVSIGISVSPDDGHDSDTLLRHADLALYRAKERGRNRLEFFTGHLGDVAHERRQLDLGLRDALTDSQFEVFYQPQVRLATDTIIGYEALVRWNHPDRGLLSPESFLLVAEDTGLIGTLDAWVLKTACRAAASWGDPTDTATRIAVNLSPVQFTQRDLVGEIERTLGETGLSPTRLELELTEGTLLQGADALETLQAISALGVRLAIDDFGTGYSALSYLRHFPLTTLKVDRTFIQNLMVSPTDQALVRALVDLSHALSLDVIAEGVEMVEQRQFLQSIGCDIAQGYLFGVPAAPLKAS